MNRQYFGAAPETPFDTLEIFINEDPRRTLDTPVQIKFNFNREGHDLVGIILEPPKKENGNLARMFRDLAEYIEKGISLKTQAEVYDYYKLEAEVSDG